MFPFLQLPRIYFEYGAIAALPGELAALGIGRPLLVTDRNLVELEVFDRVRKALPASVGVPVFRDAPENPTVAAAHRCADAYRAGDCDGVVAVGGGSVIDCAKAAAFIVRHAGTLDQYLGRPDRITSPPAPLITIPTTAGSGSEVSRGCGIHPDESSRAKGLNHPLLVPKVAICDPELTLSLPSRLTAGTGMDALTHCVEGILAKTVNPLVDAIALDGVKRVVGNIERVVADGRDREARSQLMLAALQGGISIYKGLGPAHAISNTCGDRGLHHGIMTALALPPVLRVIEPHLGERMAMLGTAMGCTPGRSVADAVDRLNRGLGLPRSLRELGYGDADLDEMATDAADSFFNLASAYRPTREEYRVILAELLDSGHADSTGSKR